MNTTCPNSVIEHSTLVCILCGEPIAHISPAAYRACVEALQKVREDVNWMLNNQHFLNPDVFAYLDAALAQAEQPNQESS